MRSPALPTAESERGHRRGVVLGLTMAELLLLLLFCLLLASAGVISEKEKELDVAKVAIAARDAISLPGAEMKAELVELHREVDNLKLLMPPSLGPPSKPIPSDTWKEIVLAKTYAEALAAKGIGPEKLADPAFVENSATLVAIAETDGLTPENILKAIEESKTGTHDWPPIITLGNDQFRFQLNSAELSPSFQSRLKTTVIDQVRDLLSKYDVDVVEVVGHTDEQPINSSQKSTLDALAIPALSGQVPISELIPADNSGLGLARAIAVANALQAAGLPSYVKVIPLSAAQLILPGDVVSLGDNPEDNAGRRRIEIRVRRSTGDATQ